MRGGQWNKKKYKGVELFGKTLGLIGFGRISRELAKKATALGMKVIYTNRRGPLPDADGCMYREMNDLLRQSDFISIHIPFDKKKGPIIAKEQLGVMKEGAFLVNTSRGGIVDENALLEALKSGKISGAALDVYENEPNYNIELVNHPKVSCTPHIGAYTWEAQRRVGEEVVLTLDKFFNLRR
jgi:D-3-phosphoglycerate dehydrogenase